MYDKIVLLFLISSIILIPEFFSTKEIKSEENESIKQRQEQTKTELFHPTSVKDLEVLISTGKGHILTVLISNPRDISMIASTGVIVMTQEPDYVVIIGDEKRIDTIKSLGFTLREPVEADHKLRAIKIWLSNKEQFEQVLQVASDVWPVGDIPGYVYGQAFDYQIKLFKDKGYKVESMD